jgi:homoserine trans-succinylase
VETVSFSYDPLALVRIVLQRYVEEKIEGKYHKAKTFACYEFLRLLTNENLENILRKYVEHHNLEAITLKDWKTDGQNIFELIFETDSYQQLETDYKRKGFGSTGLGVYDKEMNRFYDCARVGHWDCLKKIVADSYSHLSETLEIMWLYSDIKEHDGITRDKLESFLMNNFELVGGDKPIDFYL